LLITAPFYVDVLFNVPMYLNRAVNKTSLNVFGKSATVKIIKQNATA